MTEPIAIRGDMIRLGQLLKLADVVDSGGEAKALLAAGDVRVNGEPEQRAEQRDDHPVTQRRPGPFLDRFRPRIGRRFGC